MSSATMNASNGTTSSLAPVTAPTTKISSAPSQVTSANHFSAGGGTPAAAGAITTGVSSKQVHATSTVPAAPVSAAPSSRSASVLPNPFQQQQMPQAQLKAPPPSSLAHTAPRPITASTTTSSAHANNPLQQEGQNQQLSEEERIKSIRPTAIASGGGTKRTLLTHTKDGKLLSEKKLRRLEKNRLSARECRRRKREATENLEREINVLEAENLRLRLQLQIGKEAEQSRLKEQEKLTQDIDELLKSGASEAEVHATLEEFKEKHADYGKSRRSATEFHLRNIKRLLMPTQTTSLVMHAIQGGDTSTTASTNASASGTVSALGTVVGGVAKPDSTLLNPAALPAPAAPALPQPAAAAAAAAATVSSTNSNGNSPTGSSSMDPKSLFQLLVKHLDVTPQQAAALKDSRFVASELDGCLEEALAVLTQLQERLAQTAVDLEAEFNNVRQILTPTQAAKFLVWVANNHACMHLLNELWDRVHPTTAAASAEAATRERTDSTDDSP